MAHHYCFLNFFSVFHGLSVSLPWCFWGGTVLMLKYSCCLCGPSRRNWKSTVPQVRESGTLPPDRVPGILVATPAESELRVGPGKWRVENRISCRKSACASKYLSSQCSGSFLLQVWGCEPRSAAPRPARPQRHSSDGGTRLASLQYWVWPYLTEVDVGARRAQGSTFEVKGENDFIFSL